MRTPENDIFWIPGNNYSQDSLREKKGLYKYDTFIRMGVDFSSFSHIVDLGCGNGVVTRLIARQNLSSILGIDHSVTAIAKANHAAAKENLAIRYLLEDVTSDSCFSAIGSVDCCISLCLLEHIRDEHVPEIMTRIRSAVRPGGRLLLTFSNKNSIFHVQRAIMEGLNRWKYGYSKSFTTQEVTQLHQQFGFELDSIAIKPCDGGRGVWSITDRLIHLLFGSGRYIFTIATRK